MGFHLSPWRRALPALALATTAWTTVDSRVIAQPPPAAAAAARQPNDLRPAERSPLTATNEAVFAIDDARERVISRPADLSGPWRVVDAAGRYREIGGLSAVGTMLYVTDSAAEEVYEVDLATQARKLLASGQPFDDPGSIALAGDVFVADNGTGKVYRLRDGEPIDVVLLDVGKTRPLSLAALGNDLLVASPDGSIREYRGIGLSNPQQAQAPMTDPRTTASVDKGRFFIQRLAHAIKEPSRMAVWRGIVYVIDQKADGLLAYSRGAGGIVRASFAGWPPGRPDSIAVNDSFVYALFGEGIRSAPRFVPALVKLRTENRSGAMADVYTYLAKRGILPLQSVELDTNLEHTLLKYQVLVAPDRYEAKSWDPLVCQWNPRDCQRLNSLRQNTRLRIPDLHSESFVDVKPVTLDGSKTLGAVVDERIRSEAFWADWRSEKSLRTLNEPQLVMANIETARDARVGTFVTPIEYLQYLVPALPRDLAPDGDLKKLELRVPGVRVITLEERQAQAQAAPAQDPPESVNAGLATLHEQYKQMRDSVSYLLGDPGRWEIPVGIVELVAIDNAHPDLIGAFANLPPAGPPAPAKYILREVSKQPVGKKYAWENRDHATMVASIIAARRSGFEYPGLAPRATLYAFTGLDTEVGEAVSKALTSVKIFNVSEHFGKNVQPDYLLNAVQGGTSLFIVAAGNDNEKICDDTFNVYPACWYNRQNVITVTATTSNGSAFLPEMNWSPDAVHLAAPGEGFSAAGFDSSYVPVRGTSFATPIVTSAAALLYEAGVTTPWGIKQRLIATADPLPSASDPPIQTGRLNIRRALTSLGSAYLIERDPNNSAKTKEPLPITVSDTEKDKFIFVKGPGGITPINPFNVLRVQSLGGARFRIVYIEPDNSVKDRSKDKVRVLSPVTFPRTGDDSFEAIQAGKPFTVKLMNYVDYVAKAAR